MPRNHVTVLSNNVSKSERLGTLNTARLVALDTVGGTTQFSQSNIENGTWQGELSQGVWLSSYCAVRFLTISTWAKRRKLSCALTLKNIAQQVSRMRARDEGLSSLINQSSIHTWAETGSVPLVKASFRFILHKCVIEDILVWPRFWRLSRLLVAGHWQS
jgi:hypothetical protein